MDDRNYNSYSNIPPVTKNLMIVNALFWLSTVLMAKWDLVNVLGLHYLGAADFRLYQLFTYMFMHGSFGHLFFNMFAVYMFGRILESVWGSKRFLFYYIVTGLGAAVVQILVWTYAIYQVASANGLTMMQQIAGDPSVNYLVTIGASGAVFGILLAFGMLFPETPLYIMFIPIPVKAKYFVIGYGVIELFAGVANFSGDHVAHFAHLGGMLFGIMLIVYWRKGGRSDGGYV